MQRLAQMARAAGIHLIMATPGGPSVDVITGTHQGQLPIRDQLPGHLQDRRAHHPRRTGGRAAAGPGRHALPGRRRADHPPARPVRLPTARSRRWPASCARRASRSTSRRSRPRRRRTRKAAAICRRRRGRTTFTTEAVATVVTRGPQGLHQLHPAPPGAGLAGYNRAASLMENWMEREGLSASRQPRRQARDPGRPAAIPAWFQAWFMARRAWTGRNATPKGRPMPHLTRRGASPRFSIATAPRSPAATFARWTVRPAVGRQRDPLPGRAGQREEGRFEQADQKGGTADGIFYRSGLAAPKLRVRRNRPAC